MSDTPVPQAGTEQTILLQPGTVAEVMTPENRLIYVGKIEKIQNGGVYIRELNDDTLPMVLVNKPVKVRFYQESGNIVLHAKVCGSTIHMWKVDRLQSTFVREQRAFFRQSISIDIEARCSRRAVRSGRAGAQFPCNVLDISAGGILISCPEIFVEGDRLLVDEAPLITGAPAFSFNCQIRRASEWRKGVNRYGCQFESLSPRDQDRLLQAIFTIQRQEIKKRKPR